MAVEQIPGNLDIKLVQGDDFICQFNIPFSASGYTFITSVQETNNGIHIIPMSTEVQSSILSVIQTFFYASITTVLESVTGNKRHNWQMKYTDNSGLVRTFISGRVEVV